MPEAQMKTLNFTYSLDDSAAEPVRFELEGSSTLSESEKTMLDTTIKSVIALLKGAELWKISGIKPDELNRTASSLVDGVLSSASTDQVKYAFGKLIKDSN